MVHKVRKFGFYSDPSHGWMKVSLKELQELGLIDKISPYSYAKDDSVYLEEDSDATKFLNALEKKTGTKIGNEHFVEHTTDRSSKIRGYAPYDPTTARRKLENVEHGFIPHGMEELHKESIERRKQYPFGDD